jgi:hypothetical protein
MDGITIEQHFLSGFEARNRYRLENLMGMILAAAQRGESCPTNTAIMAALNVNEASIGPLFGHLVRTGRITVRLQGRGGSQVRVVAACDGSWSTSAIPPPRNSVNPTRRREAVPARRCLTCQCQFQPRHRFNFRCCGEGAVA